MQVEVTSTVAAVCRDAIAQQVDAIGEITSGDPFWPVQFELMQAWHRFNRIVKLAQEVQANAR